MKNHTFGVIFHILSSQIISRRRSKFLQPRLVVLFTNKTPLRLVQAKNLPQGRFLDACPSSRTRT